MGALGSILGGGGGGMSQSSSATSGATSGDQTAKAAFGDFNFKSASGASSAGGGISPIMLAGLALVALVAWSALRK